MMIDPVKIDPVISISKTQSQCETFMWEQFKNLDKTSRISVSSYEDSTKSYLVRSQKG